MQVTLELLKNMCPKTKPDVLNKYINPLNDTAEHYDLNVNSKRLAGFLSQVAHESGGFNFVQENLNYSSSGLMNIFKKYFPNEQIAKQYERKPEKIANRVYASRMGNGDENSGDGWKYRGRGLIQLTGKFNYTNLSKSLGLSLEETVSFLETPEGAVSSAGWFWDTNNLNKFCDNSDFAGLTKRVNGGLHGWEDREQKRKIAMNYLK
jgi:putative chitinase